VDCDWQVEWLSRELTTSELLLPANFLSSSRAPSADVSLPADRSTSDRASSLGKMEKALAELMDRLNQLMEIVVQLEATMRQLVRGGIS